MSAGETEAAAAAEVAERAEAAGVEWQQRESAAAGTAAATDDVDAAALRQAPMTVQHDIGVDEEATKRLSMRELHMWRLNNKWRLNSMWRLRCRRWNQRLHLYWPRRGSGRR